MKSAKPHSAIPTPERESAPLLDGIAEGFIPHFLVRGIHLDSRKIKAGDLFVALGGHQEHGLRFAAQAAKAGCSGIVYDAGDSSMVANLSLEIPLVAVDNLRHKLGLLADRYFGQPSKALEVIGITGTNGKTSCSHFLAEAISPRYKAGVIGTLGWGTPGALNPTTHTTLDAVETHRILNSMKHQGFHAVAMEASSHGLDQGRLDGVRFQGAVFTNISRDHLDYHKTMEAYQKAKLKLLEFPTLKFVVFNQTDALAEPILSRRLDKVRYIGFGPRGVSSNPGISLVEYDAIEHLAEGLCFRIYFEGQSATVEVPIFGGFNVENSAATIAALIGQGYTLIDAVAAMAHVLPVPGRMQNVSAGGRRAVIDYAHTPDAMAKLLNTARAHCSGELWVVFGCGGDRDSGKRPEMGAIADRLADRIVVTDDNPRTEDSGVIIQQIMVGITAHKPMEIPDRRCAIEHALTHAKAGDLVVIAGKGHEDTQEIQGVKYPFKDSDVVKEILG
jgi:UDP-N-acetylmuramoyl-L-alanyl-D-glutamate--2,6-diaminopimelate ligase